MDRGLRLSAPLLIRQRGRRTLDAIAPPTCVHVYLGAVSAPRYLCPPATVSVSFRFHSACNSHSALEYWRESPRGAAASPRPTDPHRRLQEEARLRASWSPAETLLKQGIEGSADTGGTLRVPRLSLSLQKQVLKTM